MVESIVVILYVILLWPVLLHDRLTKARRSFKKIDTARVESVGHLLLDSSVH